MKPCSRYCPGASCDACVWAGGSVPQQDSAVRQGDKTGATAYDKGAIKTPASTGIDRGRDRTGLEFDVTTLPNEATPTSVYLYFDDMDVLIYVGVTSRGVKRQREHNSDKEWWQFVARQEVRHFDTRAEALTEERRLIVKHHPPFNRVHNPGHTEARAAYFTLRAAREVSLSVSERKAIRRGLPLMPMAAPLRGHTFTLFSAAIDSAALTGDLDTSRLQSVKVSTPQRQNSGRIIQARYAAGMLMVGIAGKYLPEEVTHARAMVSVVMNRKPAGFEIKRILLNENDDNMPKLVRGAH